jgi:hypothetical protein
MCGNRVCLPCILIASRSCTASLAGVPGLRDTPCSATAEELNHLLKQPLVGQQTSGPLMITMLWPQPPSSMVGGALLLCFRLPLFRLLLLLQLLLPLLSLCCARHMASKRLSSSSTSLGWWTWTFLKKSAQRSTASCRQSSRLCSSKCCCPLPSSTCGTQAVHERQQAHNVRLSSAGPAGRSAYQHCKSPLCKAKYPLLTAFTARIAMACGCCLLGCLTERSSMQDTPGT